MGLTTTQGDLADFLHMHSPTVLILTETKLLPKQTQQTWIRRLIPGYQLQISSCPQPARQNKQEKRAGQGGVLIALRDDYCQHDTTEKYHSLDTLTGMWRNYGLPSHNVQKVIL